MDRDRSLKENGRVPVCGAAVLHLSFRTGRSWNIYDGTNESAHELISKDASCKIYLSQDSSSFENWDKVFLQTDA